MAAQVTGVESTILLWIHRLATPALDAVFRFSNLFGLFPVCTAVVAAMVVRHIWRGERKEALLWLTSGHAVAGAAFYPLMGWDLLRRRAISAQIGYAIGAVFGIFVGCGRLYLGVHWPSDVLAGWFLGFLQSGAAVVWLARRSQESASR
jgi:membrane-associated phospholipid phosphatase